MEIIKIYIPDIEEYVDFKRIDYHVVDKFVEENENTEQYEFMRSVLDLCVRNLEPDIVKRLKTMSDSDGQNVLKMIFNGCIMLNPGLDIDEWLSITKDVAFIQSSKITDLRNTFFPPDNFVEEAEKSFGAKKAAKDTKKPTKKKKITKANIKRLDQHLKNVIIGQDQAIDTVVRALKRSVVGIGDQDRPLGVFLFAGSSGVGKSEVAKRLHEQLFDDSEMIRIDLGEFQHKHDVQKLLGSPPSYVGYEDGGQLTNQVKLNPQAVVLLDEAEKAHPDVWNVLLRAFDEGYLTDGSGETVSFRETIIIMTTNLGNRDIASYVRGSDVGFGQQTNPLNENPTRKATENYVHKAIDKYFRPEFLNRIDEIIVFNHLTDNDLLSIANLEMLKLCKSLQKKNVTLEYGQDVVDRLVEVGTDAISGARGLKKARRDYIDDRIADLLIDRGKTKGTKITASWQEELSLEV